MCLSVFLQPACSHQNKDVSGFYSGKLGDNLEVTLSLKQLGKELNGYYHYNKNNSDIRLSGKIDSTGNILLEEFGYFEVTGIWSGKIDGDNFNGSWTSGDKKRTLNFSLNKTSMKGLPGDPTKDTIAFGSKGIDLPVQKTAIPANLAAKLFQQMVDYGEISSEDEFNKELFSKAKNNPSILFEGENIDLNNDGNSELIVTPSGSEGACTAQNCSFWIFKKDGEKYDEILYGSAGVFGYLVLNFTSNNYHNIALIQHSSAVEHEYLVYSFEGSRYQQTNCITQTGNQNNDGSINLVYKEHSCFDNIADHEAFDIFIGYFKDFETGDYIHAVFKGEDSSERSFWLPGDENIEKTLSSNKGRKFEVHYVEKNEFIPEAGDTILIEMIESVEKIDK